MAEPYVKYHYYTEKSDYKINVKYRCPYKSDDSYDRVAFGPRGHWDALYGFLNPAWRAQVSRHENASTDMSAYSTLVSKSPAFLTKSWRYLCKVPDFMTDASYEIDGFYHDVYDWSWSFNVGYDSSVANEAAARFYNRASSFLSPVKGGVILGELKETIHLLRNPLRAMRDLISAHDKRASSAKKRLKGGSSSAAQVRGVIADSWLELVFGWLPLQSDVQDIVYYLSNNRDRLRQEFNDISGSSQKVIASGLETYPCASPGAEFNQLGSRKYRLLAECRQIGQLRLAVGDGCPSTVRDLGLIPEQFLPTLWEIMPWSFLIDYFTNIGDLINSFSFPSSRIVWISRTERGRTVTDCAGIPASPWVGSLGTLSVETRIVRRTVPSNFGLPSFDWDLSPTTRQLENILALIVGTRARHVR